MANVVLELHAAKDGALQTLPGWNEDYNSGRISGVFAAVCDYAADFVGRRLWLRSVRKDMRESAICTSTVFLFNADDLYGSIVHYYGSTKIIPTTFNSILIPDLSSGGSLDDLVKFEDGLCFAQALLNRRGEGKKKLKECVRRLSGVPASETYIWTPNPNRRKQAPIRVAFLGYGSGGFHVSGGSSLNCVGRSRGMYLGMTGLVGCVTKKIR